MLYVNFVCTGNTCRSPMAEAILKAELKKRDLNKLIRVKSSGIYAETGAPMSEYSKKALKELGIPVFKHMAKQYIPDNKSIVITMTSAHKKSLPKNIKAVSISELTGGHDVDDPYGRDYSAYKAVAEYLIYAIEDVITYIIKVQKEQENESL